MRKRWLSLVLAAALFCLLAGCGQEKPPRIAWEEAAELQPGEQAQIEITPELREHYFKLARLEDWFHMPVFAGPEALPTDPLQYWFMLMAEGRTGWDEYGNLTGPSPWLYYGRLGIENYYEIFGIDENGDMWENREHGIYTAVSQQEFDGWVRQHFGEVQLQHQIHDDAWHGKNYYFDGETYYFTCMEGPSGYLNIWELAGLTAANEEGKIVYTADLSLYVFAEYGFQAYYEPNSYEENVAFFEDSWEGYPENRAIYDAYRDELLAGSITLDEAARQMIIAGDTADFPLRERIRVRFYIDEQTQEPFYLQLEDSPLSK